MADGAAARVRESHLAFIEGRTADAVAFSRSALAAARAEGAVASGLAWYAYQLGDTLIATGDRAGAATAYGDALAADPTSHLAHWGPARVAAADGRIDDAIAQLDAAIAVVPLPEFVARRADLYAMRGGTGDAAREAADRKTVLAIAQLYGEASASTTGPCRCTSRARRSTPPAPLSLARDGDHGPQGRLRLRRARRGRCSRTAGAADADAAMQHGACLRDARRAGCSITPGMIATAVGDAGARPGPLEDALALDADASTRWPRPRARGTLATLR